MKIVMLDIDGVLNSARYIKHLAGKFDLPANQMDPNAVARLNTITNLTGAKIVVSSTWRLAFMARPANPFGLDLGEGLLQGNVEQLARCMGSYGITGEVVGMTPRLGGNTCRGDEIQWWLNQHNDIEKFIIIDDSSDMGHLMQHLINTSFNDGLEDKHVKTAISILGLK